MACEYRNKCNLYDTQSLTCSSNSEAQNYCGKYDKLSKENPVSLFDSIKKGLEKLLS